MSQVIGRYFLSIAAAAMLLSLLQSIIPKGPVRQTAGFVGGLLVVLAVLSPVVNLDFDGISHTISEIQIQRDLMETDVLTRNKELTSDIIKQRCESYIWDKARELGIDLQVTVSLGERDGYPYPVSVILTGKVTQEQRKRLSEEISQAMGIPGQQQEWNIR